MIRTYHTMVALVLALLFAASARAQDDPKKPDRPGRDRPGRDRPDERPGFGGFISGRLQPLLTRDEMEKLGLKEEQKAKVEKIVREFEDRRQASMDKLRKDFEKARESGDSDAVREVAAKAREISQGNRKAREEAEAGLKSVLNDEQKKKFEEIKKDRPFPGFGGPRPAFPGFRPGFPLQPLPPFIQERLELSKEQKEQLEKLQKEFTQKLEKMLTEEQRKKLKEMREFGQPGGFPDRPDRPRPPGRPPRDR